jgi:hypothetical protein
MRESLRRRFSYLLSYERVFATVGVGTLLTLNAVL